VFLAGHLHISHIEESAWRYRIPGYSALVIQAGTATSTRERVEMNSWDLLRIASPELWVARYPWDEQEGKFIVSGSDGFRRNGTDWEHIREQLATGT
jgi:hypothetical protein